MGGERSAAAEVEDDAADAKLAQLDEPIVGSEVVTWQEGKGPGAREARPLPAPKAPTSAAWEKHKLTHLPYCSWCPICASTKRPNHHHRCSRRGYMRSIPFLVADYCYIRNSGEDVLICLLVVRVYPWGIYWATVVDNEGIQDLELTTRLA